MKRLAPWLLLAVCLSAGCRQMGKPQWFNPGTTEYQRQRAQRFDPYPDDDIGPPIAGGRPPGYTEQNPEVTRSRWNTWGLPRFGHN